jgi:hypothetical protein
MKVPMSGSKVITHNRMMNKKKDFWFLINEETRRVQVCNNDIGALLLTFTSEDEAEKVRQAFFEDSFTCHLENLNMSEFFYVILGNPDNKGIKRILLNPPSDFFTKTDLSPITLFLSMYSWEKRWSCRNRRKR